MALSVHIKKKLKDFELAVDFDMEEGIVGFLGSSGCGKSMTLKCIAGIETLLDGEQVGHRSIFAPLPLGNELLLSFG